MSTEPVEVDHGSVVRDAWAAHLGDLSARPDADFFEAGGNSLLAASMMGVLSERFDRPLTMRLLARNPTLDGLSRAIADVLAEDRS